MDIGASVAQKVANLRQCRISKGGRTRGWRTRFIICMKRCALAHRFTRMEPMSHTSHSGANVRRQHAKRKKGNVPHLPRRETCRSVYECIQFASTAMRPHRRLPPGSVVFLPGPALTLPSGRTLRRAISCAVAESAVQLALHPFDGLCLRRVLNTNTNNAAAALRSSAVSLISLRSLSHGVLACLTGAISFSILYTSLFTRLQNTSRVARSALSAAFASGGSALLDAPLQYARDVARVGGNGGWMFGSVLRELPFDAFEFGVYAWFSECIRSHSRRARFVKGVLTGALVGALVAPMDIALARSIALPRVYNNIPHALKALTSESVSNVLGNVGMKCVREGLGSGIFFALYESLEPDHEQDEND